MRKADLFADFTAGETAYICEIVALVIGQFPGMSVQSPLSAIEDSSATILRSETAAVEIAVFTGCLDAYVDELKRRLK